MQILSTCDDLIVSHDESKIYLQGCISIFQNVNLIMIENRNNTVVLQGYL